MYGQEVVLLKPVTLEATNQTLWEILKLAFASQPVSYEIKGKHIILRKQEPVAPLKKKRKYTISGYVTDETSRESLIGVNILETTRKQGTITNPYGFYSITFPEGVTNLSFSYMGYVTQEKQFHLTKDTVMNIKMNDNNLLEEVVIVSDKRETGNLATQMGAIDIPLAQIQNTPVILGEADVMKTIQLLPGVQSGTDGSAGLHVRGGGPEQNLILLDGVPLYNVDHLMGFFSVFTPEAIKKVSFFKGSFPARFGGRLSSVVDVRTNDGDMQNYHGSLSVGLVSSRINLEGPIIKDRTFFNISARRTYIDLLAKPFIPKDNKFNYHFYDVNAKINHRFSDQSRLFLSFYNGRDKFSNDQKNVYEDTYNGRNIYTDRYQTKLDWGNLVAAARWNYIFNNRLFSNTTVSFNRYQSTITSEDFSSYQESATGNYESNQYSYDYSSGIKDVSYNIDLDYNPSPRHHVKFGTSYTYHAFRPETMGSRTRNIEDGEVTDIIYNGYSNQGIYAHEASLYGEDNIQLTSRLKMNLGVHFSMFHVNNQNYTSVQPRLSLRYEPLKDLALKASYTQMSQYIHLLTSSYISLLTDLWVPVTDQIEPMSSHQYVLGAYYTGIAGWEFSVEGYYKTLNNVLEYKDGSSFFGSSTGWEKKVEMGKGRSYGIEFMAQKQVGNTTGWISYAIAKSDRQFKDGSINDGKRFPYKYDRRHTINIIANHAFNKKFDIGASWVFQSGSTMTIPEAHTTIIIPPTSNPWSHKPIEEVDYVTNRNNYRLSVSHYLNVGMNFHKKTKHGIRTWSVGVYNVYNSMNPNFIYKENKYIDLPGGWYEVKPVIEKVTFLPFITSVTYTYKF